MKKTYSAYFGPQTQQSLKNFPFPLPTVDKDFICAIVEIKQAAARANKETGVLPVEIARAIETTCKEILHGVFDDQFVTPSIQGGAGTSINMNVNEVIAARATEILHAEKKELVVHPNDHVNCSQSTNDVNPSALRITCLRLMQTLETEVDALVKAFSQKSKQYHGVKKLGRTHLQDAVPITVGEELGAYADIIFRDLERIVACQPYLLQLNLGGTAVGNKVNVSPSYMTHVYKHLKKITHLNLEPATNLMSLTSSATDFCALSSAVTLLFADLSKIATDLRILSSGPQGGIAEYSLASLQPGSSIMPGKVNPVAAESINQTFYFIAGKNQTILQASEASCLQLAVMFPVIAESLISSLKLAISVIRVFRKKCIEQLEVRFDRCTELLEHSSAYATVLTPKLGYDVVSQVVKASIAEKKTIGELVVQKGLLTPQEFSELTRAG